jgi:sterol desaturase/sphingolipid hydroxylase (fatty acid hydroxylase superfamily)
VFHIITSTAAAFVILLVLFRLIEHCRPVERRLPIRRPGFWTDVSYWAVTPLATRALTRLSVILAILPIVWLAYGHVDRELILNGFGPASRLPLALQACLILVLSDFVSYWGHRLFHRPRLWPFHAVHHSSETLDWLSSVRVHPVNDAVMRVASTVPIFALGFAPKAVASIIPLITLMAILLHANVDWDWGPFRSVLASPRFHRWHHTSEADGRDKNFAGIFPLWDILFGTYFMPKDRVPVHFGTDTAVPHGLFGQLLFPFKKRARP